MLVYSGNKDFNCEICDNKFAKKHGYLKSNMKSHYKV